MLANKLEKGDTIGVISPSNYVDEDDMKIIENSKRLLERNEYKIKFGRNCFKNSTGYGASAKEKADDINEMYQNKNIKAIMSLKGGFNSNSVFEYLDLQTIKNNNKIICGYSDATAYINYIVAKTGNIGFIGPNFKTITSSLTSYCYEEFISHICEGNKNLFKQDDKFSTIIEGKAKGKLIGGNLSLISEIADSLDFDNKILFLEEFSLETPPALASNYIYNLKQKGVFNKINGLWIGNYESEMTLEKIIIDTIKDLSINIPIIKSNNFGHTERIMTIPIGVNAEININEIKIIDNYLK